MLSINGKNYDIYCCKKTFEFLLKKICELEKDDYNKYRQILKKENVEKDLLTDTTSRKIKKLLVSISPKLYYQIIKK